MTRHRYCWLAFAAFLVAAGCEATKSENPLSPSIAGPIAGVEISTPKLFEPGSGWKLKSHEQPITLFIENAWTTGPRPLYQRFEVAADAGFTSLVFVRDNVPLGAGGQTRLQLPETLPHGRTYFWRARAADGANTGAWAEPVDFEIQLPARVFEPTLLEPLGNPRVSSPRPTFRVANAQRQGPVGPIHYTFQVSFDAGFARLAASGIISEQSGVTSFTPSHDLPGDTAYYWRAHASDGQNTSAWVGPQTFRTPGAPPPAPGPAPGAACSPSGEPITVVTCRRAQYPALLSPGDAPSLLRAIAHDLNGGSTPYYGILKKTSGNNCGGYACDIICAKDGSHWDVFIDGPDAGEGYSGPSYPSWGYKGSNSDIASRCELVP